MIIKPFNVHAIVLAFVKMSSTYDFMAYHYILTQYIRGLLALCCSVKE